MSDAHILLTLRDVKKRYGKRLVLQIDAFDIVKGTSILLTGANGSGKSTFLRILAGISTISEGRIDRSEAFRAMRIGFVPQIGGLYEDLTLRQNLEVFRTIYGTKDWSFVEGWLSENGPLGEAMEIPVGRLSRGIRQLATIGCALSTRPDGLLLDEPVSDLDVTHQEQVYDLLSRIAGKLAFLVVSTHDTRGLEFLEQRVSIREGKLT
jgi:ABC-type multidrug transport system ATPase subunit